MSDETIFHEVTEELRRDRMRSGWRRYGPLLIGAAVAVVLLVAANEGWSWWQNSNSARSSDQFFAALSLEDGGDLAGAQKALDTVVAEGTGQYPVLAKFKQAGLLAKQGKKDDALAAFDALATASGNQRLKELALLFGANLLVDKGDVGGVKSRVEGLMSPDNPLRNSARETLGLAQYKSGDLNGARDSFEAVIADPITPDEARGRMQLYVAQLVSQGATPPATTAQASTPAGAAAAAVQALGAATGNTAAPSGTAVIPSGTASATAPAAANDNGKPAASNAATPADASSPAGVEANQSATPDSALDLAVPAAPATPAPADTTQPMLSTGTGLPTPGADTALPATTPADGAAAPAVTTVAPAPAAESTAAPAASSTAAPAAAPAAGAAAQPAPAAGTTSK